MRIQYWTELFWPYIGGQQTLDSRLLPALRARGLELQVVTSHGSLDLADVEEWKGIQLNRFRFREALAGDLDEIAAVKRRVAELKREFRPHVVHVALTDASPWFHLRTRAAHRCATLVEAAVAPPRRGGGEGTLLGELLRSADWVVACSEAIRADLERLAPAIGERSSVLYPAREAPRTPPSPLPLSPPVLLCLGRVVRAKGFDLAVEALARVAGELPSVQLVVAGDGPERTSLEERAAALGLSGSVRFVGWISPERVPELVNGATIGLLPSRGREGFGLAALEAALMARPVVAARVGGVPEHVLDGITGLLVEEEDVAGRATAVLSLLEAPERAAALGQAGREQALARFSLARRVEELAGIYARIAP